MAIEFLCPACQGNLRVADDAVGRVVRCGSCLATLRVPNAAPTDEPLPSPGPTGRPRPVEPISPPHASGDRDEHGEPVSLRRRGASGKKKAGRGVLFWLVAILMLLGLLTCLACGGLYFVLATPRWHEHKSPDGGFTVQFPAQPNPDIAQQAKLKLKANEFVVGTMLIGRLEAYWIWYADIDPITRLARSDDDLLKETIKNLAKEEQGKILSETPRTVDGFQAREEVISLRENETHHCLIVVAKSRVYVVAVGGPLVTPQGNDRVRKFLDSFHVTAAKGVNPFRGNPPPKNDD